MGFGLLQTDYVRSDADQANDLAVLRRTYINIYNIGLFLLSLALVIYGIYMMAMYNTTFARVMVAMNCIMLAVASTGLFGGYLFGTKAAAIIWGIFITCLTIFTLLICLLFTFWPTQMITRAYRMDNGADAYRTHSGKWIESNQSSLSIFTLIATIINAAALASYLWLSPFFVMLRARPPDRISEMNYERRSHVPHTVIYA